LSQGKGVTLEAPEQLARGAELHTNRPRVENSHNSGTAQSEKVIRSLEICEFSIKEVALTEKTEIKKNCLYVNKHLSEEALQCNVLVKKISIDVIRPSQRSIYTNTIMDILPIATKKQGSIGDGVTYWLSGVTVILTGIDEDGRQVAEFGSSHGWLDKKIRFGMPGTPGQQDIILRINVVIEKNSGMERRGPLAAHQACDVILDGIRREMKKLQKEQAESTKLYQDARRPGRMRVLVVKQVGGQGAMHEKLILPEEPGGVRGGRSIIDMGNVPVILSANEIKDGAIRSMT
jgi:D-proline reductase (dithiol) PrdA